MKIVVDSGVFMNHAKLPDLSLSDNYYITQSAFDEINSYQSINIFELFRERYSLSIIDAENKFVNKIVDTAKNIGQNNLSSIDIEVLALALQLKDMYLRDEVILITDDYGLRNVGHQLKINTRGLKTEGGSQKRRYKYRCIGCKTIHKQMVEDCDICGSTNFQRLRR